MDAVVSRKSDGGEKEKEKGEKPNSLSKDGGQKATEKVTAIATATTTKAVSDGAEEGSNDVGSFGGKKKTAVNDDIASDAAGESPPSSLMMAESTATALKAGPAGVVARGPRGGGGITDDRGGKAVGGKDDLEEAGEYAERQARMRRLSDKRRAANEAESGLGAKREALSCLAAERDARQDTIDRLRSAEEMAVRAVRRLPRECRN